MFPLRLLQVLHLGKPLGISVGRSGTMASATWANDMVTPILLVFRQCLAL